jgi:lipid-A-disaccharide synthase-like uncharacterized protein
MSSTMFWLGIGFAGQAFFTARFLFQWLASERKRSSVVPAAFWWFSLLGGITLLVYAIHRRDPVIIVGQAMGLVVYIRNLMLVEKSRRRAAKRRQNRLDRSLAPVTEHASSRRTKRRARKQALITDDAD